jgi:hypothetical protein
MSKPLAVARGHWHEGTFYRYWIAVDSVAQRAWEICGYAYTQYPWPELERLDHERARDQFRPLCGEVEILGE